MSNQDIELLKKKFDDCLKAIGYSLVANIDFFAFMKAGLAHKAYKHLDEEQAKLTGGSCYDVMSPEEIFDAIESIEVKTKYKNDLECIAHHRKIKSTNQKGKSSSTKSTLDLELSWREPKTVVNIKRIFPL
ncbi:MAG: hypothetical protein LBT90_02405 [Holosporaceae bacterium]|nr:hypothetical protein [Holosporaceae bacterium]